MRLIYTLLLTATLAVAQQAGRVTGRVLSSTGEPVSKASVRITRPAIAGQPASNYVEVTSSDGRFTAENIPPGRYSASAQRPGYAPARTAAGGIPAVNFDLAAGETESGIEIHLTPLAVISGVVTDADGDPVPLAQVRLIRYAFNQGRLTANSNVSATTDDRGMFRLLNVQPGRYYLLAIVPAVATANEIRGRSAQEVNLPTYYPNVQDIRAALGITVASTEVGNVNIRLRRGGTYSVKGKFVGPGGAPVGGQVTVFTRGSDAPPPGMSTQVRDPGTFQLSGLPAGDYTIVVRSTPARAPQSPPPPGASPSRVSEEAAPTTTAGPTLSGRLDISIGSANVDDVTIRMTEGAVITGRVTIEGGTDLQTLLASAPAIGTRNPAPTGTVNPAPPTRTPSIVLLAVEGPSTQVSSTVSNDGTFRIPNIPPVKRILQTSSLPLPNAYVKSIRFGGQDVTRTVIDLSSGTGGVLDIMLSTKGAEITATPLNDKGEPPIDGAPISIWPRIPNPASPTGDVRFSAPASSYRAQGLPPGEYYVSAWETATLDYLRVPDFLARFVTQATKVTVAEGEAITVEPKVISREAIEKEMAQFP